MVENDSQWLTFRQLADAAGLSLRAAEARARRNIRAGRWLHRIDNDARRTGRVLVPPGDLAAMRQGKRGVAVGVPRYDTRPPAPGTREGFADPVLAPLRAALEAAEDRAAAQAADLAQLREGLARREGELDGLKEALRRADLATEEAGRREAAALHAFQQAQGRAERAEAAAAEHRGAEVRATAQAAAERAARQAAEAREAEAASLLRQVVSQLEATHRERVEAQSRMADLRHHLDRAEAERDGARTEVSILREAEARATAQAAMERVARQSAEASWQAAETELDRARGELTGRSMGGPVARAWRAFLNRRGRP